MIRKVLTMVAVLAIGGFVAAPAEAGGTSTKSPKIALRFKNIGAQPVLVNAKASGSNIGGGVALSQNGVYGGNVSPGAYMAYATGLTNKITTSLSGSSKSPIYLYVEADNTATTITVAPPF